MEWPIRISCSQNYNETVMGYDISSSFDNLGLEKKKLLWNDQFSSFVYIPWICSSSVQVMGVVVMHSKMVKSIERVSGTEKTSKKFKGINVSKTVLSSACCSVTSCNNEIKIGLFTLKTVYKSVNKRWNCRAFFLQEGLSMMQFLFYYSRRSRCSRQRTTQFWTHWSLWTV